MRKLGPIVLLLLLAAIGSNAQERLYTNTFSLSDVVLLDGPFKHARNLNIETILKYDADRLLAGYRKEAGLPAKAKSYENWEGLDGHVGGHYLSALAMNVASTKNAACIRKMNYFIAELNACQQANGRNNPAWGNGYAGAVPASEKVWSKLKQGDFSAYRAAWVPWYNLHKTYAGLRDAWLYAKSEKAKAIFLKFCDWAINLTAPLSDAQMQSMLDTEHGGMNEVFADAFEMTGNEKYLKAAKRFSHRQLLAPMANNNDNLDNKHANTQVPKAIGFQRIGELDANEEYNKAAAFFWETVTTNRTLAFGGNSRREHFPAVTASSDFINEAEGPETCNSYNMLKLSEGLFRQYSSAKFVDYYERTLYNHILSTQHPVHGGYVYFTPARPRHYRVYSAPNLGMWCCVGSGMENHSKYNQFIYTHRQDSLFVNLFIASALNWKSKKITLRQETTFPYEEGTKLRITAGACRFNLMVRYPSWVQQGALKILVNGKAINFTGVPSSYVSINRLWKKGDVIEVKLPMQNTVEHLPNVPEYVAFLHGPILLAAKTGTEDLRGLVADDGRWAHIASGKKLPLNEAPILVEDHLDKLAQKLRPAALKPLTFTAAGVKMVNPAPVVFEPFFSVHDARYMMYWMALSKTQYQTYIDSIGLLEKKRQELDNRTIDFVAPGEQQPEADHQLQQQHSGTGNNLDEFWRDARSGGFFSYALSANKETGLSLVVRYWGAEWGSRRFDIYVDDRKLVTEDNTGKWNQSVFQDVEYLIPDEMTVGKETVRIKFQPLPGSTAGAVYHIRLVRKN